MKIGSTNILLIMKNDVNRNTSKELVPYLLLDELADVESFKKSMKEEGIEFVLQWRYYYGYNDAIRIIDFVETKGIYDAWAVLLPIEDQAKADQLAFKMPALLSYFEPAEERFFRGLKTADLEKALASKQMKGQSLTLALKILKEQGIVYDQNEIQVLKDNLVLQNIRKGAKVARTKALIWAGIIIVIVVYLYFVGLFEF